MKNIFIALALAGALIGNTVAFASSAAITGPAHVHATGISEVVTYHETSIKTNIAGAKTNYTFVLKSTTTNFTVDTAWLLARLENSFHTNFPVGSQLLLTGNGPGYGFRVIDTTGTNFSFDPSPVLSTTESSAYLYSGTQSLTTTNINTKIPVGGNDTESITSVFTLSYDDSAMTNTTDHGHVIFSCTCLAQSKSSETFANGSINANVTITLIGSGQTESADVILNGTLRAKTTYSP